MQIVAFVPCRAGSERVLNKNTLPFAGDAHGLTGIKLKQLLACAAIDRIVLSTNDARVIEIAMRYAQGAKIEIIRRVWRSMACRLLHRQFGRLGRP
jgi:CMP-N-acetylneuraminic acid synthetase